MLTGDEPYRKTSSTKICMHNGRNSRLPLTIIVLKDFSKILQKQSYRSICLNKCLSGNLAIYFKISISPSKALWLLLSKINWRQSFVLQKQIKSNGTIVSLPTRFPCHLMLPLLWFYYKNLILISKCVTGKKTQLIFLLHKSVLFLLAK